MALTPMFEAGHRLTEMREAVKTLGRLGGATKVAFNGTHPFTGQKCPETGLFAPLGL